MGSFANAQHFLQMQQQRVQQQLQAQQMQLLQLKRQQAALANASNTGSLGRPGTAVPPISAEGEGMGFGSGAVTSGGGNDDLDDLNTGGLGGTGFSPAPPGDDNVPPVRPASGNDSMQLQLVQQMQAQIHHQQQILNGTSLQLHAGANGSAGVGGGELPVGAAPDPLPTGVNLQVPMGSMMSPGQFQLQQQEAGGVGVGGNQGEVPLPATPSDPAEEQPDIPNITSTDSDTTKEAMAQPKVAAVGTTPTPVADAQ